MTCEKPIALFDRVNTRVLDRTALLADDTLARLDPSLSSLVNLNTPADYDDAQILELPAIGVERFGVLRSSGPDAGKHEQTRAATLGALAETVGIALDAHVVAALNGEQITTDAALPLVAGDRVAFLTSDGGG